MVWSIDILLGKSPVPDTHLSNVSVEIAVVGIGITYPEHAAAIILIVMLCPEVDSCRAHIVGKLFGTVDIDLDIPVVECYCDVIPFAGLELEIGVCDIP